MQNWAREFLFKQNYSKNIDIDFAKFPYMMDKNEGNFRIQCSKTDKKMRNFAYIFASKWSVHARV